MLFPPLPLASWRGTRDTLRHYARLVSAVRRALTPPQPRWQHVSLRAGACGLTSTPIPAGGMTCELLLDFTTHDLSVASSHGHWWDVSLEEQSVRELMEATLTILEQIDVRPVFDRKDFYDDGAAPYNSLAVETFWQAITQTDILLKQFKGQLKGETTPVQFWPHNFDLACSWFTGHRPVDDNGEAQEAQLTFGLSTGDAGEGSVSDAYYYVTAYPHPSALEDTALPAGAYWFAGSWRGAVLPYEVVAAAEEPRALLLDFWRTTQRAGADLMRREESAR